MTARRDESGGGGQALAVELRILIGALSRRLREQAHSEDLTGSQKAVILLLERDGQATVTTLAKRQGVRPQSMGATVAALEGAALVQGSPDAADGRQTIWSLTDKCREMLRAGREAKEDWLFRALTAMLSAEEQQEVARSLKLLERLVDLQAGERMR